MTSDLSTRSLAATPRWLLLGLIALALVAAIVARFSFLGDRFNNDAGLYAAMGMAVHNGHQLYVEIWDTKLPGITLLTAPLYALFGSHWWMWVSFEFVAGVGAAILLASTVRIIVRRSDADDSVTRNASLATLACGLVLLNLQRILISGFQLETPMTFCTVGASYAVMRGLLATRSSGRLAPGIGWALVAGLMGGLAATLKPTGLAVVGAAGVLLVGMLVRGDRRWWQFALAAMIGLGAVVVLNLLWIQRLGVAPMLPDVWHEIGLYASGTPWSQVFSFKTGVILAAVAWPLVAIGGATLFVRRASGASESPYAISLALLFAASWLAIELLGVIVQKRVYAYHFLPVAAPTTLLVGLLIARMMLASPRVAMGALTAAVVPLALLSFATSIGGWRDVVHGTGSRRAVVEYLDAHTTPDDRVFADPVGTLSVLANRRPGARLGMLIHFVNHDAAPEHFSTQVIDDLERTRCDVVVLPTPPVLADRIHNWEMQPVLAAHPERTLHYRAAWERLLAYVHSHYTLEQRDIDGEQVWRRNAATVTTP